MNGWEFRLAQEQDAERAGIPVIVLSAVATESWSGIEAVSAPVPKPVEMGALPDAVERYATADDPA